MGFKVESESKPLPDGDRKYPPHLERVKVEATELSEKIDKLSAFLNTEAFRNLPGIEQSLLQLQMGAMTMYYGILSTRLL